MFEDSEFYELRHNGIVFSERSNSARYHLDVADIYVGFYSGHR